MGPPMEGDAVKPKEDWTVLEEKASKNNPRTLNAIFGVVSEQVHTLIFQCEISKDARNILATTYEGTDKVKESVMQILTTRFETLTMRNDQSVAKFTKRLMKIANDSRVLGEAISKEKLVKKALRALSEKFAIQRITISESNNLKTLRLEELMGSLSAYETDMKARMSDKKPRAVALKIESVGSGSDSDDKEIALLARNFKKFLKKK